MNLNRYLRLNRLCGLAILLAGSLALSACQGGIDSIFPKAETPIPQHLMVKMKAKGMTPSSPILLRIFKTENVLEVWKKQDTGRYGLLETYEICKWSGKLGPKFKEGDRQAPEGFYRVGRAQMNPNSEYHLSFNIGYPNTFDRAHGRTGTHLMVHGACSSAGCYSMTDELVEEIYALARDAHKGGQDYFQVQAYPFRMTAANLAKHAASEHFEFWKMLKEGSDFFEMTNYPPKVDVCEKRYLFNREAPEGAEFRSRDACPQVTMPQTLLSKWQEHLEKEKAEFTKAIQRHKLLGTFKDTALANVDVKTISMMAAGSEVLPSPTPKPEPEPVVATQTPITSPDTEVVPVAEGVTSGAANEAVLAGRAPPAEALPTAEAAEAAPAEIGSPAIVAVPSPSPAENATTAAVGDTTHNAQDKQAAAIAGAIPVPQKAPRSGESPASQPSAGAIPQQVSGEQPKPRPWWMRKTRDEQPTSLIAPQS